jgi:hypothetical protein
LHHPRNPQFCGLFPLGYPQVSDKTCHSTAAPSIVSSCAKREYNRHVLHHFAIWQCWEAAKSLAWSWKSLLPLRLVYLPFIITYRWKKYSWLLFGQTMYVIKIHTICSAHACDITLVAQVSLQNKTAKSYVIIVAVSYISLFMKKG